MLLFKVFLFQTTKKSIKHAAVAVAVAAAAEFWVPIKTGCFLVFGYGIHCFKSYLHCGKHGLVCDPCNFLERFFCSGSIACKQPMECACLPLCACLAGCLILSLPLLAWLSCCWVGLLACCLVGWLARLVGSLAGLLVGWLPGWLVGWLAGWFASWLLGWQVACFN